MPDETTDQSAVLVALFRRRRELVQAAARTKANPGQAQAPARVEAVMANVRTAALEVGLDAERTEQAYRDIVALFIAHETAELERGSRKAPPVAHPEDQPLAALGPIRDEIDALDREIVSAAGALGVKSATSVLLASARAALAD